jgi:hypothetical protein
VWGTDNHLAGRNLSLDMHFVAGDEFGEDGNLAGDLGLGDYFVAGDSFGVEGNLASGEVDA